jgi:glycosyltransferase involved in cell wall biosynthesis
VSLPTVSVVMPVFDRADLVTDSLSSVQEQTGIAAEIIVVDDGSTDGTHDVLRRFARRDPRIRVLRTPHAGPAAARNSGIAAARGEYLTFLDSDDMCPSGRIRRQVDKLAVRPDVVAVVGALQFFEICDVAGAPRPGPEHEPFHDAALQTATFRTECFRGFGPLDETLDYAEDVDFFLRLLEVDARLIVEADIACLYRAHAGNMTRDARGKQQGYVRAYARSLARRRASGRTRPLQSFFPRRFERDTEFGGGQPLQEVRPTTDPPGLLAFVNAFYLCYWLELTELETLCVQLQVTGRGSVRVLHLGSTQDEVVIARASGEGCGERFLSLEIPLTALPREGVLTVEIDESVQIRAGAWVTFDPPRREVRLAIVICSLNRRRAVEQNLQRLAGADAHVIVVHQGEEEFEVPDEVELLRQPNFGGSGGFTRGIMHALDQDATHVLLLDDDVRLEPEIVPRLRSLLAYLARPTTIGGQMLDLTRPTMLFASHEAIDLNRLELLNPLRDVDLSAPGATALFARQRSGDYAAWWCCCIAAESLRETLPLPMFVRHDDIEYGLHTTGRGSAVVTMPGIFVWHEPFGPKVKLWYTFYDRRNKLIVGAIHGALSGRQLARLFLKDCWEALTVHRYDICWALCQATRDFLAGPAKVFSDPRPQHEEIVAGVARYALMTVRSYGVRRHGDGRWVRSLGHPEVARPVRAIVGQMLGCAWRLLLSGRRVSATYRATREHYGSREFWRSYLGVER